MRQVFFPEEDKLLRKRRFRKGWRGVMAALGAAVVLLTAHAVTRSAVALEVDCRLPEHTHDDSCYTQVLSVTKTSPLCAAQVHTHQASCWDDAGNLVCGYGDFLLHRHDDACYDESGTLWCPLPEILPHAHTEACYTLSGGHVHSESCYTSQRGELLCSLHVHTEDCWTEALTLICEEEHTHDDSCYQVSRQLTCGQESDHVHTDDCYAWELQLTCGQEETEAQPVLSCGQQEILPHGHTADCFDSSGSLTCGRLQVLQHQHGPECFHTEEIPVDTEALTCTDETHTHTARCYGLWELTCTLEEHTHGQDCVLPEETEPTQPEPQLKTTGLPVMGTAYGETDSYGLMTLTEEEPAETAQPVDLSAFISVVKVKYQVGDDGAWTDADGTKEIPGNARFRITIEYDKIPIDGLLAAGGRMCFTLPDTFRNANDNGAIRDAYGKEIGTITAVGQTAEIVFSTDWLNGQKTEDHTVISGDFYVQCWADLSKIPDGGEVTVKFGDIDVKLTFDNDLLARYGDVSVQKTVASKITQEETGDYLEYQLTVAAGADGCSQVTVQDALSTGKDWAEEFLFPEDANVSVLENGTFTWNLGDMAPNETRTLAYRVKLKPGYTGASEKGNIQNTADVYSKTYKRDTANTVFKPSVGGTISKVSSQITPMEDGSAVITYYVWVQAYESNSYTLKDLTIRDALDGSVAVNTSALRKHLSYDKDSFKLYSGGASKQDNVNGLEEYTGEDAYLDMKDNDGDGILNDRFTYYVGSLAPGEGRTLVYSLKVEPGVYVEAGNNSMKINNRAEFYTSSALDSGGKRLNGWTNNKEFGRKIWARKTVGAELTEDAVVAMTQPIYDTDCTTPAADESFTVPAGSFRYQVLVNEAGDWDLSAANLTDTLGMYMHFVGYVRVDAYSVDGDAPAASLSDSSALAAFENKTPVRTYWVKIDDATTFSVTPGTNLDNENYAYRLTYYAKSDGVAGKIVVRNDFTVSGTVIYGDYSYTLAGVGASASVTVAGDGSFQAEKRAWYYEEPKTATGDFAKGAIYWAIKVDGSVLPAGFSLRDTAFRDTADSSSKEHYMREASLAGVYTGSSELDLTQYADFAAASGQLTQINDGYTSSIAQDTVLTLTLNKDITLPEGQSLYIIIKTEPKDLPAEKQHVHVYCNRLETSFGEDNWLDNGIAEEVISGNKGIYKLFSSIFTYDGTKIQVDTEPVKAKAESSLLTEKGKYVSWLVYLNHDGTLSGKYRVLEQIPEGLELTYIRLYSCGDGYQKAGLATPQTASIDGLESSWTCCRNTSGVYYVNGQQAIMDVTGLYPGKTTGSYGVTLHVVCRVTDPAVLLGGETKEFTNTVRLLGSDNTEISSDTDGVSLSVPGIRKEKDGTAQVSGSRYAFSIKVNERGIDLMPGGEKVVLVDELGENLIMDTDSIVVKNTATGQTLDSAQWRSSVENDADGTQTLRITLPDDLPLTITYSVIVNAPPNQLVTVSNSAHWEGYAATEGSSVEDNTFEYTVGGTAGAARTPQITVYKLDQYNNQLRLSGAEFRITAMALRDGILAPTDWHLTGVTDENGTLIFGTGTQNLLSYNTVYELQETAAPEGYVLDAASHCVLIAQAENGSYPDYSAYLELGVTIHYASPLYTYTAYNHRGEIEVIKAFQNADGSPLDHRNGTYRFGLFADAEGTQKMQETSVVYAFGRLISSGRFTDVECGKTYYVYELDDESRPIRDHQSGTVGGIPFVAIYDGSQISVSSDTPKQEITVTNRLNYPQLPMTGGAGTAPLYALGGALMLCAALLLLKRRRRHA